MVDVLVVATEELGDRSYVVHDGTVAIVVDPQRDLDRIEAVLAEHGLHCTLVLETHIHNDYVSGGYELARHTGADYVVAGADSVEFERRAVSDGDELATGDLRVRVIATPGHTDGHLSYIVEGADGSGTPAVFTGGSLLFGSVGRTDLVDPDRTEELTRHQYRSTRKLADLLPDEAAVFPTHGFGSFCSSGAATGGQTSTVGLERTRNDALVTDDEDAFVAALVAGLTAYPAYYAHMDPRNREGAGPIDLALPTLVDADELAKRIAAGEWVVDLRSRSAYAAGHLRGTVGIALDTPFATYLGWIIPWGAELTLLGESPQQVTDAQRQLARIGIDRPDAAAVGDPESLAGGEPLAQYPTATFADLASQPDALVLDVRREDERRLGGLAGSLHIPLHQLGNRMDELPSTRMWVHCAGGFRASIAASLLDRAGHDIVLVDDDWANAADSGRPVEHTVAS